MNSNHKLRMLESFVLYAAGFFGFYIFLVTAYGVGVYGLVPYMNIGYRVGFLGLSILLVGLSLHRKTMNMPAWFIVCYVLFWGAWLMRLYADGVLGSTVLRMSPLEYFQRAILVAAIPAVAFAVRLDPARSRVAFWGVYGTSLAFVLLALYVYRHTLGVIGYRSLSWHGYDAMGLMSPLVLAYNAAALASLSLWGLTDLRTSIWRVMLYLSSLGLAAFVIVMSGGRGAMVVVVVVFGVLVCTNFRDRKVFKRLSLLLLAGLFVVVVSLLHPAGRHAWGRIATLVEQVQHGDAGAGSGRMSLYTHGLKQFASSPIVGDSLVVSYAANYPHNYIIEALMATGIIGGIPFVVMFLYAFYKSVRMQGVQNFNGWIGILYVNVAVAGMFSFSLINNMYWYALVAVVANLSRMGSRI